MRFSLSVFIAIRAVDFHRSRHVMAGTVGWSMPTILRGMVGADAGIWEEPAACRPSSAVAFQDG